MLDPRTYFFSTSPAEEPYPSRKKLRPWNAEVLEGGCVLFRVYSPPRYYSGRDAALAADVPQAEIGREGPRGSIGSTP